MNAPFAALSLRDLPTGPRLWLVPTPVGNMGDITARAVQVLAAADAVACEDTRRTAQLLQALGLKKPLLRLDAHRMHRAEQFLSENERLAYVSDAGTPGISDPGAELVRLAHERGLPVEVLPGATAFVPALVLSGLPLGRFCFEGFLPRKGSERRRRLKAISARSETTVLYESPHRLAQTLLDLAEVCGDDRQASVTRELSKKFEETRRGGLRELAAHFAGEVRGEIVVVVAGADEADSSGAPPAQDWPSVAARLAAEGHSTKDIRTALVAQGLGKKEAYACALAVKDET